MNQATQPAAAAGTIKLGELTVNRMGFGAMRVAGPGIWGEPKDRAAMRRLLARAFELGHTFFDTADSYGPDVSEILIAEALHPYPQGLVIGTKGGLTRPSRARWDEDGRPEHLRRAVDGSLRKLRIDRIDLYQFHAPDPGVPYAESIGALAELQRARSQAIATCAVVTRRRSARRSTLAERSSLPAPSGYHGMKARPAFSHAASTSSSFRFAMLYSFCTETMGAMRRAASSCFTLTLETPRCRILPARSPVVLPIPGTASIAHLEENAAAGRLELSPEDLSGLARACGSAARAQDARDHKA